MTWSRKKSCAGLIGSHAVDDSGRTSLADGEQLDVPGRLQVIATPGHTPGHCSLLLADRGVLFGGEALTTFDPATRTRGPRLAVD